MEVAVASGKRKSAIARAYVKKGKGIVRINNMAIDAYPKFLRQILLEPIEIAKKYKSNVNIEVNVKGGGQTSQIEAARTAIAKALVEFTKDEELKRMFMDYDRTLLVSDIRRKEPKKQLGRGARKRRQKSYR